MDQGVRPDRSRTLLRGAGLAALSRAGAVIEIAAQSLFIWLVGLPAFGLYASLWAGVVLVSTIADLAMTSAMQRLVPQVGDVSAHAVVKLAMLIAVGGASLIALAVSWNAGLVAAQFSAAADQSGALPSYIRTFIWALPLWMFVEIASAALRSRKAFGPEIRTRVFWEQIMRMAFAVLFFAGGAGKFTPMAAHLASLAAACALYLLLLRRYFDLPLLVSARIDKGLAKRLLLTGGALFPSNLARRTLIHGPALALNFLLPGGQGAAAAGLFEVARRIATVPYLVRQSFDYVLAPLAAESAGSPRANAGRLYALATRMTCALVLPLSAFLIFAARDVLGIYRPEVIAALPMLIILVLGRACDAVAGPAQTVIEMTGSRALPVINNGLGLAVWLGLLLLLVPAMGGVGMAVAVAAATTVTAWAAVFELRQLQGSAPLRRVWRCLIVAGAAGAIMGGIEAYAGGPARLAALVGVWLLATWLTLRWGLEPEDKHALGRVAVRLRL